MGPKGKNPFNPRKNDFGPKGFLYIKGKPMKILKVRIPDDKYLLFKEVCVKNKKSMNKGTLILIDKCLDKYLKNNV